MLTHLRTLNCVAASLLLVTPSAATAASGSLPERTFSEIIAKRDTVLIARRHSHPVAHGSDRKGWGHAQFQVVDLLKGDSTLVRAQFTAPCRIEAAATDLFLLAAVQDDSDDSLHWRLSQPVTQACRQHIGVLAKIKVTGAQRLAYFRPFLEHADQNVAANAHLEFVIASDEAFSAASAQLDRVKIRQWLKQTPDLPDDRRRLYLAMLARCGTAADVEWLRNHVVANREKHLLDAWIGCYLALKGADGLPLIHRLYLTNPEAEFFDTYNAIVALRFIRDQFDQSIPEALIIQSLRLVLEKRLIADLVVPDLAFMKDWDSLDRIVELFDEPEQQFARVAVVNFVRACPNPVAKERLKELTGIDAKAVKKAHLFFPHGIAAGPRSKTRIRRHYRGNSVFKC